MTDRELRRALADLSGLRSDEEPIVSLYLDTHWNDEKQRERARVFIHDAAKRAVDRHRAHPQLDAMRRTLARASQAAEERIEQQGEVSARGLALFACEARGLWHVMQSSRPFKDELCVDGRPHLLQLARLADDVEPAVIAFVHAQGAHFYEVALGDLVNEATIEGPLPRTHRASGFHPHPVHRGSGVGFQYEREQRNQRHQEEARERNWRAAALYLEKVHERGPRAHVVLVGTGETVAAFEKHLPERLRQDILARLPRPPGREPWKGNGKHELVAQVVERVVEHERAAEARQVERVVGEALRGGLAVLGAEDVVLAVNERRVHRLILEEDFERSGWRCRNCSALGATHDEVCSFCQGPLARVDALGEELAGRVLAEDGEVEVVAHTNRLHSYGRVAALLRQSNPSGLSGARAR